jgi:hypothetical protein
MTKNAQMTSTDVDDHGALIDHVNHRKSSSVYKYWELKIAFERLECWAGIGSILEIIRAWNTEKRVFANMK